VNLDFDFQNIKATEFGVGRNDDGHTFFFVPVDGKVQAALHEMAVATWDAMQAEGEDPAVYEPSEKYAGLEYVYLPLNDALAEGMRQLHTANNLPTDSDSLKEPADIFCYFVRMVDGRDRRLPTLRRATQFKGVLKRRLIRLVTDALMIIEEPVFTLDTNFDLLIDGANLHILRPSGFEFAGKLQEAVLAAVPKSVLVIQQDLSFVDLANIQTYATQHPRAARYLASIRTQELKNMDKDHLKSLCEKTGVPVAEVDGKLTVEAHHVMGFLEVLDRRRYEVELVRDTPERYKAGSRRRLTE